MEVSGEFRAPVTLTFRGEIPQCILDRRFDGPQSRSGNYGEVTDRAPAGYGTPAIHLVAHRCTDGDTPASG